MYRELAEYEMTCKYNARRDSSDRYLAIKKRDSNRKQPLYPPPQADDYLTPVSLKVPQTVPGTQEIKTDESEIYKLDKQGVKEEELELATDWVSEQGIKVEESELNSPTEQGRRREELIPITPALGELDMDAVNTTVLKDERPYQPLIAQNLDTTFSPDGYVKWTHSHSISVIDRGTPPPPPLPPKPEIVSTLDLAMPMTASIPENTYGNCPKPLR